MAPSGPKLRLPIGLGFRTLRSLEQANVAGQNCHFSQVLFARSLRGPLGSRDHLESSQYWGIPMTKKYKQNRHSGSNTATVTLHMDNSTRSVSSHNHAWAREDREFFKRNPHRQFRIRDLFPGEFEDLVESPPQGLLTRVIVRRVSKIVRIRYPVFIAAEGADSQDEEFLAAMLSQVAKGEPMPTPEFNVWLNKTPYTGPKQ